MLSTLSWIRCVRDTSVTDPHVASIYISWFSHHLAPRIVSRVEKLGVKLWQLASRRCLLRSCLPARCFLRGPKWRLSLSTTFISGYGAMAGRLSHLHYISTSRPVFSIFLDPSRSNWMASKLQQTPAWSKLNIDIWKRQLLRRYRSMGVTDGQKLKSLVCTICYQVPCTNRSKNEVLSIIWFVIFWNSFVFQFQLWIGRQNERAKENRDDPQQRGVYKLFLYFEELLELY